MSWLEDHLGSKHRLALLAAVAAALALGATVGLAWVAGFQTVGHRLGQVNWVAAKPRWHGGAFVGAGLYWLGDIFCLWAALHAFSAKPPPVAQLVVAYATGYALSRRTLLLGGAGVVEAFLPVALGWFRIELAPAVLAVFMYRLINLWLPVVPALVSLPALRRLSGRGRQPSSRTAGRAAG